jgi:hypothetical protein
MTIIEAVAILFAGGALATLITYGVVWAYEIPTRRKNKEYLTNK